MRRSIVSVLLALLCAGYCRAEATPRAYTMIFYTDAGNPFWPKVIAGADEAARAHGFQVDYQFAKNDPVQQIAMMETAVASGANGLAVVIHDDRAYDQAIAKAIEQKVPVIAFNIDDSEGAAGNQRMAYVGQDLDQSGYKLARHVIATTGLKAGAKVACPVELPEATYARLRYRGVKRALDELGIESEMVNTGAIGMEDTLNKLTQYLMGRDDVDLIIGLGGMPTEMAPQAIREVGLEIPNAGFDVTKPIIQNILDGRTLATIDQQPFYQGYMTVTLLHYYHEYGLPPMDIATGLAIIDQSNAQRVLENADKTR